VDGEGDEEMGDEEDLGAMARAEAEGLAAHEAAAEQG
jgi:hypothetical protein